MSTTETDYQAAIDEMFGMIKTAVESAAAQAIAVIDMRWPGMPKPAAVPMDSYWARISTQIVTDNQSSLTNANGVKRFRAIGLLYFQLFCPRTQPSRLDSGRQLAELVQKAFRSPAPSGSIQFRSAQIRELPPTEENYPINVVVTFEYDSVQ